MSQFISVYHALGDATTFCIEEGASNFAGTASHCDVQLAGDDVEPIHCMFTCLDGQLTVQDWNTNGKTLLNGSPLNDESAFAVGDELSVGTCRIVVGNAAELAQNTSPSAERTQSATPAGDNELTHELERLHDSNCQLEAEFASFDEPDDSVDSLYDDPFAAGDTELLRNEIEQLQVELAERDQQLKIQSQQIESGDANADLGDTSRLVTRMEELLDELQSADERMRTYEELLRTSDDATQAEQEERQQLESWVEQIEDRVTAKDEEAQAEVSRLNQRIQEFIAQQKHNEQVLAKAIAQRGATNGSGSNELVQSLQSQVADLQENWQKAQAENLVLAKQAQQNVGAVQDSATVVELQQKVMQLEMDAARERAEVARERAELAKLQAELEQQSQTKEVSSESDIRLKAMRDHLRELHSEEEVERESRRQRSLGGRIANLFTRIESR